MWKVVHLPAFSQLWPRWPQGVRRAMPLDSFLEGPAATQPRRTMLNLVRPVVRGMVMGEPSMHAELIELCFSCVVSARSAMMWVYLSSTRLSELGRAEDWDANFVFYIGRGVHSWDE